MPERTADSRPGWGVLRWTPFLVLGGLFVFGCSILGWCGLPSMTQHWFQARLERTVTPPLSTLEADTPSGFRCPLTPTLSLPITTLPTQSSRLLVGYYGIRTPGAISPDGTRLLRFGKDQVSLYDPMTLTLQRSIAYPAPIVAVNPDLTLIATYLTTTLTVWEVDTGVQRAAVEIGAYPPDSPVVISHDGAVAVIGSQWLAPRQSNGSTPVTGVATDVWDLSARIRRYTIPERMLQLGPQDQSVLTAAPGMPGKNGSWQLRARTIDTGAVLAAYDLTSPDPAQPAEGMPYLTVATTAPCVVMVSHSRIISWNLDTQLTWTQPLPACDTCWRVRWSASGRYSVGIREGCSTCSYGNGIDLGANRYYSRITVADLVSPAPVLLVRRSSVWAATEVSDAVMTPDDEALIVLTKTNALLRINRQTGRIEAQTVRLWLLLVWLSGLSMAAMGGGAWWWRRRHQRPALGSTPPAG